MSRDQPTGAPAPGTERPSLLAGAGHVGALWALAVAQPLLDLLGRNPDFFVARGNTAADILVVALGVTLAPPLLALGAEALARLVDERLRWGVHLALVGLLTAALAVQVLELLISRPAGPMVAAAAAAGAAAAWLYGRAGRGRFLRSLLDVLIPAPLIVLAVFLLFSESSRLVLPQDEAEAADLRIPSRAPVVFVVFDELPLGTLLRPSGEIDAERFPSFARLAASSTWYRGATAAADSTPRAVPALLTGRTPGPDELPVASDQPRSLFTLLGGSYEMRVHEEATRLCPEDLCPREGDAEGMGGRLGSLFSDLRVVTGHLLLPDGLREGLPDVDQTFGGFATEVGNADAPRFAVNDQLQLIAALHAQSSDEQLFASFLAGMDGRDRALDFLHLEVPHYPWVHLPDGRQYTELASEFKPFFDDAGRFRATPAVTDTALARHLLETGYADTLLGETIESLRRDGAWRRALVVVVSDHGASFIPGDFRRSATRRNAGQLAPVPLFVKSPGQRRGRVTDRHFCLTRLLPLLARELGAEYPWEREPCSPRRVRVNRVTTDELGEGVVEKPLAVIRAQRDRFVRRIARLFGSGGGWGPVFALGPAAPLVGRPVAAARLGGADGAAEFDDPGRFARGRTAATLLRGDLPGEAEGTPLAVAVNGRFVASDRAFEAEGETSFSVLFPPGTLRRGPNVVELYAVRQRGREPVVALLGSA